MTPLFEMPAVKVISVRQPWAWLIVTGRKDVENRTWATSYRGTIFIHAAGAMHQTPIAAIEDRFGVEIDRAALTLGAIVGRAELVDVVARSHSPWFEGPRAFVLRDPVAIEPVPMLGRLGIFSVPRFPVRELGRVGA